MSTLGPEYLQISHIEKLIALGAIEDIEAPDKKVLFDRVRQLSYLNRQALNSWSDVCDNLSVPDHLALLKAVTLAEKYFNWKGGSVAAAIWVYRSLENKVDYSASCRIAQWVINNSDNDWVPFGSSVKRSLFSAIPEEGYDSGSGSLYFNLSLPENIGRADKEEQHNLLQSKQKKQKEERLNQRKIHQQEHKDRRQWLVLERDAIIEKSKHLTPLERLQIVADDPVHPLAFFPIEWASVATSEISRLTDKTKEQLSIKTKLISKGPWEKLYKILLESQGETKINRK